MSDTLDFHEMPAIVGPERQRFDPNAFQQMAAIGRRDDRADTNLTVWDFDVSR